MTLSENEAVNNSVLNDLCPLFTSGSTLVHLYLDKTSISFKGLRKLLASVKTSLKVRTISVKSTKLTMRNNFADSYIALLKDNMSLTCFGVDGNDCSLEFLDQLKQELDLNGRIVKLIFP